jgi:hypothetical protein
MVAETYTYINTKMIRRVANEVQHRLVLGLFNLQRWTVLLCILSFHFPCWPKFWCSAYEFPDEFTPHIETRLTENAGPKLADADDISEDNRRTNQSTLPRSQSMNLHCIPLQQRLHPVSHPHVILGLMLLPIQLLRKVCVPSLLPTPRAYRNRFLS